MRTDRSNMEIKAESHIQKQNRSLIRITEVSWPLLRRLYLMCGILGWALQDGQGAALGMESIFRQLPCNLVVGDAKEFGVWVTLPEASTGVIREVNFPAQRVSPPEAFR